MLAEVKPAVLRTRIGQGTADDAGDDRGIDRRRRVELEARGLDHLDDRTDHIAAVRADDHVPATVRSPRVATDGNGVHVRGAQRVRQRIGQGQDGGRARLAGRAEGEALQVHGLRGAAVEDPHGGPVGIELLDDLLELASGATDGLGPGRRIVRQLQWNAQGGCDIAGADYRDVHAIRQQLYCN